MGSVLHRILCIGPELCLPSSVFLHGACLPVSLYGVHAFPAGTDTCCWSVFHTSLLQTDLLLVWEKRVQRQEPAQFRHPIPKLVGVCILPCVGRTVAVITCTVVDAYDSKKETKFPLAATSNLLTPNIFIGLFLFISVFWNFHMNDVRWWLFLSLSGDGMGIELRASSRWSI